MQQALAPPGNLQQPTILPLIPAPRQSQVRKSQVEGNSMSVPLGLGDGPIDIPEDRLKSGDPARPPVQTRDPVT